MTTTRDWAKLPEIDRTPEPMDPTAMAFAATYGALISVGAATSPRSLQLDVGASEIGAGCDRQIAYKAHGVPAVNFRDPLRTLAGTGLHSALAEVFTRLNHNTARYLVETAVTYRNLRGTVDLYDRATRAVVDWKSADKKKIRYIRHDGVNVSYQTQVQIYAAGLKEAGEDPLKVAVVFVPFDGEISDIWAWVAPVNRQVADDAIDRYERLTEHTPNVTPATPSRLCPWCDHHMPGSTNLWVGCPGQDQTEGTSK